MSGFKQVLQCDDFAVFYFHEYFGVHQLIAATHTGYFEQPEQAIMQVGSRFGCEHDFQSVDGQLEMITWSTKSDPFWGSVHLE